MPKKKLTKAQVKRKLKTCSNAMYDMILDKMGHANSDVPMSLPKLMEMHKLLQNATKRMKWMVETPGPMGGKSIVINANETIQEASGRSLEQWLLRVCVMYLLFGEKAMGMI